MGFRDRIERMIIAENPFAIGWATDKMTDMDAEAILRDIGNAPQPRPGKLSE